MGNAKRRRARGEGSISSYRVPSGATRWRVDLPGGAYGKAGFKSQGEAVAWLREHIDKPAPPGTVGEWLAKWLELFKADRAKATYRHAAGAVKRLILPKLANVKLRDLTGYQCADLLATLARDGRSSSERHKAGRVLRTALNAAVALGVLGVNPMSTGRGRVRIPGAQHKEKAVFTEAEVRALLKAADDQGKGHVVRLWLDTGLRPSELLGLDWSDIDLQKGTVSITKALDAETHQLTKVKTKGSRRTLKLSITTLESLREAADSPQKAPDPPRSISGPFVHSRGSAGGRYWQCRFRDGWLVPLFRAAGLEGRGYAGYTFRHWAASHLLRSGVPIKVVSRRLGHNSITTTLAVYAHLTEGDDELAADVMNKLLG